MRKIHRWLSVIFGLLILWISATGVLSQVGNLVNNGGFEQERTEPGKRQTAAVSDAALPRARPAEHDDPRTLRPTAPGQSVLPSVAFVCPADMTCRPKPRPTPGAWNVRFLHDLHSGASFGPAGVLLSLFSGFALMFFAFSGMWMYVQMYRARTRNRAKRSEQSKLFW